MKSERVFRIGEKMISLDKVTRLVERVLELREQSISQQEVSKRLHIDRSFVSRLETIGEIRKGNRVAVIGFPLVNTDQLSDICRSYGIDFYLILNNQERWDMVRDQQALDFFNRMFEMVARLREFDTLVMISSEKWYYLAEALLDIQIIYINLGTTPISEDCFVDPSRFMNALDLVIERQRRENNKVEKNCGN